ncbi:hypothetical protein [Opitutus sp. GAS368]|uniref:hypothetical protein n=1 Tax=Opitutus sp. GAS368 TaxID=1882749 RepID=UPI00087B9491|nr:hypothetical protein [Opitutus sp. GAS368]SDS47390.1 Protein of unknown function [Opitutus sp. GAS368]
MKARAARSKPPGSPTAHQPAAAKRDAAVLAIDENRRLLNRYRFVEQEGMRILAGWLPRTETFELKCELGRTIWEYSQHVNALYLRLREIQSPAFQTPDDAALVTLMREALHAPDEFALAAGLYRVITPSLIRALESHETATFPNSDQPSVHVITHALLDLRAQSARAEALLAPVAPAGREQAATRAWENYLRQLLAAAGGISGREPRPSATPRAPKARTEFVAPREAGRDARFTQRQADPGVMPPEEDYRGHTVEEFERYSTEMLAAETVALVMFSVPRMPWEFQYDTARHLYDEVRHCLMGYEWMRAHGMDPFASPQYLHIYKWRSQFPPVMQYCLLTMGNEVHAFPYRHRRVKAHEESGDRLSEQFVRYDIADETQHVRFGRRWLPELLKHVGEKRSLEEYTTGVLKVWEEQYRSGKLTINVE